MPNIALLGTLDTKLEEFLALRSFILSADATSSTTVTLIDVGRESVSHPAITISQSAVLKCAPPDAPHNGQDISKMPRGEVISHMILCATALVQKLLPHCKTQAQDIVDEGVDLHEPIHAIITAGGSGGTSLASAVMRSLPVGFPKMIVSTVASGDTGPIVGETDISLVYSVVDIAGMNDVLRDVLSNAAGAIVGMAHAYTRRLSEHNDETKDVEAQPGSKRNINVAISMFGNTTPCVDTIRSTLLELEQTPDHPYKYTCYVFHSTGHGGRAMERLMREGRIDAVLDVTTTEIGDHIVGGVMSAGAERLRAAAEHGLWTVVSVGALDQINFGPRHTVPAQFTERKLVEHNPTVTLMRTNAEECTQIGNFIAEQLKKYVKDPERVVVLLPLNGISMISEQGGAFEDKEADDALFTTVEKGLSGSGIDVIREQSAINDERFAREVVRHFVRVLTTSNSSRG